MADTYPIRTYLSQCLLMRPLIGRFHKHSLMGTVPCAYAHGAGPMSGLSSKYSGRWIRIGYVSAIVMSRTSCCHTVHDHNRIWIRIYPICDHRVYPIVWTGDVEYSMVAIGADAMSYAEHVMLLPSQCLVDSLSTHSLPHNRIMLTPGST